jgi:hypothetical protein
MTGAPARLLFDSVSRNTGDIAIGIASRQLLADLGVDSVICDPFADDLPSPLIIGGGELIRSQGDSFYDSFRRPGANILNAGGVWTSADHLDYLNDYEFVSARSSREAEVLAAAVPHAEVLPCATTLLRSPHVEIQGVDPGETVVGIHMVPHALRMIDDLIPIINAIPHKKVFIPFTHYNSDASFMRALPFDKRNSVFLEPLAPLELHSILGQMSYTLVSSLHASIFSYSQNVPFASVFQTKVKDYFTDRGLSEHVVSNAEEFRQMILRLDVEKFDFTTRIDDDRKRVRTAFRNYAQIVSSSMAPAPVPTLRDHGDPTQHTDFILGQVGHVVSDRDLALSYTESRRMALAAEVTELTEQVNRLQRELSAIRNTLPFRAAQAIRRVGRTMLGRFSAVFKRP